MAEKELVDIEGSLEGETQFAFRFSDGETTAWVPKSQVEWHGEHNSLRKGTMVMPQWLAKEKEFV